MTQTRCFPGLVLALVLGAAGPAAVAAPIVPGFERFGRTAADPAAVIEAGLVLVGELGCVQCHAVGQERAAHVLPKRGPSLDKLGERVRAEWLVEYLASPHAVHPGTTMPELLAGLPEAERVQTATALAHFLATTGAYDDRPPADPDKARPAEGARIYERSGCAVCHGSRAKGAVPLPDQLPLVGLDRKWSPRALDAFLKNPFHVRPSSRMPALPLGDQDRRHVVASLLGPLPQAGGDHHDHVAFQGRAWHTTVKKLPDVDSLGEPSRTGPVTGFDVGRLAGRSKNYVAALDGFFHATRAGTHHFFVSSDDGSRLLVGGKEVVDNDGVHPDTEKSGQIELEAGVHPVRIDYFEGGGNHSLSLEVLPPGGSRRSALGCITPAATDTPPAPGGEADGDAGFAVDAALAERGRAAFGTVGCARCHELRGGDGKRIEPVGTIRPVDEIRSCEAGCLATGGPRAGVPHYALDDAQRGAVAAALGWLRSPESAASAARDRVVQRTLTALDCYACHVRDGRGGILPAVASTDDDGEPVVKEPARDALFTSAVQELGDEGRLPPTLDGVGDKLTAAFLHEVLVEGGKDRTATMHTLMPKWHAAVAGPLAKLLAEDAHTTVATPALSGHAAVAIEEQGRALAGSKALGCIKCHAFGGEKGQSLGVIDMTRMPKRLRHDWFLAYVADPQRFRPGTRMPASWPEGKTFYPDVLDGTAAGQIEAVWRYLDAPKPRPPVGATANPIELTPAGRPIIYRNFIEGAGPRAIAVGYPEKVSLAWDADRLRLALAWRGAFIDAGRHWTGRGQGFQPPLGDGVFTPDAATPLALFDDPATVAEGPWPAGSMRKSDGPAAGYRFVGYRLDAAGRPTFLWQWGDCRVEDRCVPAEFTGGPSSSVGLRRTVTIRGPRPAGHAAWLAASGGTIEAVADGWNVVDGRFRVRLAGAAPDAIVRRESEGRAELRLPLSWTPTDAGVEAVVEEELTW